MKKIIVAVSILALSAGSVSAKFMYQEIDPICSISGTTHTSFPGEISDTSTWSIPTAYDGECIVTITLTQTEKDAIYKIMTQYFTKNKYMSNTNTGEAFFDDALNQAGRDFITKNFFPAVEKYISDAKKINKADSKMVAKLNYAIKIVGYDYYISQPE